MLLRALHIAVNSRSSWRRGTSQDAVTCYNPAPPLIDLIVTREARAAAGQHRTPSSPSSTCISPRQDRVRLRPATAPASRQLLARSTRKETTKHNRNRLSGSLTAPPPQCSWRWLSESGTLVNICNLPSGHRHYQGFCKTYCTAGATKLVYEGVEAV